MDTRLLASFFNLDGLAILMNILVVYIGLCVYSFAARYMRGDAKYHPFCIKIILLIFTVAGMAITDNLIILFITWGLSNILLVSLMIHKSSWKAAKASGLIAAKNYLLGAVCIGAAFTIFYFETGEISINAIISGEDRSTTILLPLVLIIIAAMTQSALWPFHRWLISSLNSPTPVSAMMHAGLVNGGGFLLIRFAPLYLQHSSLLILLFLVGLTTSLLGTLWKLVQNDIKRMLACSTMGQMGFMMVQCGLGLFPAAVAHLMWHGMFKAYLFLASGSAAQEKRFEPDNHPFNRFIFICSLLCGMVGSSSFAYVSGKSWIAGDTTLVVMIVVFITTAQLALPILRFNTLQRLPLAFIATLIFGAVYGSSIYLIAYVMAPMKLMQPQPLNIFHVVGIIVFALTWLLLLFKDQLSKVEALHPWMFKAYVTVLNASQPHSSTVTAHRNLYQY